MKTTYKIAILSCMLLISVSAMAQNQYHQFHMEILRDVNRKHYPEVNAKQTHLFKISERKAAPLMNTLEKDLNKLNAELDAVNQELELIQDKESKEYRKLMNKKRSLEIKIKSKKCLYDSREKSIRKD